MKVLLMFMICVTLTVGTLATCDYSQDFRAVRSELQQLKATLSLQGDTLRRYDAVMATLRRLETQAGSATHGVSPKSTPAPSTPAPSAALPTLTGPDLNVTTPSGSRYKELVALPGGEVLVVDREKHVVRLDRHGRVVPPAFTCHTGECIWGLVLDGDDLYVLQRGGNITKTRVSSLNHTRAEWRVPGVWYVTPGALVGKELYMVEYDGQIAFSLNLESRIKTIRKTGLTYPLSLVTTTLQSQRIFIISEAKFYNMSRISIFNATWDLISTIGQLGSGDGQLDSPSQVLVTPWSTLLVADHNNHRITEFSLSGRFLRHLLTSRDGLRYPCYISYSRPYLWVMHYPQRYVDPIVLKRYKLVP